MGTLARWGSVTKLDVPCEQVLAAPANGQQEAPNIVRLCNSVFTPSKQLLGRKCFATQVP